ncbi:rhodanese-like domain-containing protein [Alicyclobacillus tolerans]|uniref:Rhodanese-related sulfurtransferase n=1 Tax=Alicyclobacillus tolerans TaxID=90970 RepID=A0A1M6YAA1_9BACL|nr:rhodanese-like domain-containing protein [Alicyclobacillus montanus]SHL14935.1 Rhodanese-related sulfurtransferase [Alicyclobacillus montanus]
MRPNKIFASEVFNKIQENRPFDLLDLRSVAEFMNGFIPFSMNLPESEPDFLVNLRKIWPNPRNVVVITLNSTIPDQVQSAIQIVGGNLIGYLNYNEWTEGGYPILTLEGIEIDELSKDSTVLIDVRTESEWKSKQIPKSLNVPLLDLENISRNLDHGQNYVVYCAGIYRGLNGAAKLRSEGYNVRYFANGLNTWYEHVVQE